MPLSPSGLAVLNQGIDAAAVTPSDTIAVGPTRALYVGDPLSTGELTVVMFNDNTQTPITFSNVPSGTFLPINVLFVMSTGTTCTNIVALY